MRKHYHFIGIGGVGMSALARILLKKGEKVTGSDIKDSLPLRSLQQEGAKVYIGHHPRNVRNPHAVIYSSDIPKDNIEFVQAQGENIPLLHRSELLAQMLQGYAPILITGTHGKTTTASLMAHVLIEAGFDPSYAIGGYLNGINTNGHHGKGIYFTVEADESDGTFLNYPSFGAIITNLEQDHMNFWQTEMALHKAFWQFANQVGSKDHLFWCYDDRQLRSLHLEGYSYGFDPSAQLVIENFQQIQWKTSFDITFEKKQYRNIEIPLIGAHNVLNAAAVFGLGLKLEVKDTHIRKGLQSFQGVGRRLEKKGEVDQIEIYDDYAHHPTEIFATLRALKHATHGKRVVVAFQPHRFSRTQHCMNDFADAFEYADQVILTDIYAANEPPIPDVCSQKVLERIQVNGYKNIIFVERGKLIDYLAKFLKPKDVLITMGAGDITQVGPALLQMKKK